MQTFVKHLGYTSHKGGKSAKGIKAIKEHIKYIENRVDELGRETTRELFGKDGEMSRQDFYKTINQQPDRGVIAHKLCISMDRKDYEAQKIDLKELARDTMSKWESKTGRQFNWIASIHNKASNPHVHIVIAGRDQAGKEVIFKPNHLEQFKRVADQERGRLFERNMSREKLHDKDLMQDFDPIKQIAKERTLEKGLENAIDKTLQKSLDKALNALNPALEIVNDITKSISQDWEMSL